MWKKIGSISSENLNDISSRSRDENPYEPFSQLSKIRIEQSQFFPETNEFFTTNFLNKKKNSSTKWGSQSQFIINPEMYQSMSFQEIDPENTPMSIYKKTKTKQEFNQTKLKSSLKLIPSSSKTFERSENKVFENILLHGSESTEIICSDDTSIEEESIKLLEHCKSTPEFDFIKLEEEKISKKEVSNKLKELKKEHTELKGNLQNEFKHFKKSLTIMETEMLSQLQDFLSKFSELKEPLNSKIQNKEIEEKEKIPEEIISESKKLTHEIKNTSKKKKDMINKLNSIRKK